MTDLAAVTVLLPLRLVSEPNVREHWSKRAKRAKGHRSAALAVPRSPLPCTVRVTRVGPRAMDRDNNIASMKHVIDGIADRLGVKDNDPRITWDYAQDTGRGKPYAVRIEIFPGA
jgi:hypothetical protein